jgi:hypothetical protein
VQTSVPVAQRIGAVVGSPAGPHAGRVPGRAMTLETRQAPRRRLARPLEIRYPAVSGSFEKPGSSDPLNRYRNTGTCSGYGARITIPRIRACDDRRPPGHGRSATATAVASRACQQGVPERDASRSPHRAYRAWGWRTRRHESGCSPRDWGGTEAVHAGAGSVPRAGASCPARQPSPGHFLHREAVSGVRFAGAVASCLLKGCCMWQPFPAPMLPWRSASSVVLRSFVCTVSQMHVDRLHVSPAHGVESCFRGVGECSRRATQLSRGQDKLYASTLDGTGARIAVTISQPRESSDCCAALSAYLPGIIFLMQLRMHSSTRPARLVSRWPSRLVLDYAAFRCT